MLKKSLQQNIRVMEYSLKDEKNLKEILKKRLTKKEYKMYMFQIEGLSKDEICIKLNIDNDRYKEILAKTLKKINYENLKKELYDI